MKILMVTPIPPQTQPTNAVPLVAYGLLSELRQRHGVTLVTVADRDPAEWAALEKLQALGIDVQAVRRSEPQGWARWQRRWHLASSWLAGRYPWRTIWFWEAGVQKIINQLCAQTQFDLLLVDDNAVGVYRYPAAIPTIYIEHEVRRPRPVNWLGWQQQGLLWWLLGELDWRRWQGYQRTIWRTFSRIQVFTARDGAAIEQIAPEVTERVRVNPFGVILPEQTSGCCEKANTVVFVGGFSHHPNVDAALWLGREIMPLLRQRQPGVHLLLVGSHPPPEVQALVGDDIIVTGRVAEVEPYIQQATVIVAPIRVGGGMRMKVLQALALGKAVVTTARGVEGLEGAGGGWRVAGSQQPPASSHQPLVLLAEESTAFVDAIITLLTSVEKRRALGVQARAFVQEYYSAAAYAQRLEAIGAEFWSKQGVN